MSNLVIAEELNSKFKAVNKDTTIVSDKRSFFPENGDNRAISSIMRVIIAELISADANELLNALLDDNEKFHVPYRVYKYNTA